jgi:hypothetical protein
MAKAWGAKKEETEKCPNLEGAIFSPSLVRVSFLLLLVITEPNWA